MAASIFVWPGFFTNNGTQIVFPQPIALPDGSASAPALTFASEIGLGFWKYAAHSIGISVSTAHPYYAFANGDYQLAADSVFGWSGTVGDATQARDLMLQRDAANTLAQRNGINPQQFNIYNTFTDASNYERGEIDWASNVFEIGSTKAGTGSSRNTRVKSAGGTIILASAGSDKYGFGATGTTLWAGITTVALGNPAIVSASAPLTGQVAAVASVTAFTVGSSDGTFEVSANVNVTAATTAAFGVVITYTDETNAGRSLTLPVAQLAGTFIASITNVTGTGPYEGAVLTIRAKAATVITVTTAGTFTSVTYNVSGTIKQVA